MKEIIFKNIPDALDKDKQIFADGELVGEVSRGWLSYGGEQWVVHLKSHFNCSAFGEKTLKDLKKKIDWKLRMHGRDALVNQIRRLEDEREAIDIKLEVLREELEKQSS